MIINKNDSPKTAQLNRLNNQSGLGGKEQRAEASELQKDHQGAVSEIVRKHEQIDLKSDPTDDIASYLDGLADSAPRSPDRYIPVTADRYVTINGRLTLVKRGRR